MDITGTLAKLLATENLTVQHSASAQHRFLQRQGPYPDPARAHRCFPGSDDYVRCSRSGSRSPDPF